MHVKWKKCETYCTIKLRICLASSHFEWLRWILNHQPRRLSGPWFNIKMSSYQYRKSHFGDKTILRPSYLHNGISYTGKMTSLYWIRARIILQPSKYITSQEICTRSHFVVLVCGKGAGPLYTYPADSLDSYQANHDYTCTNQVALTNMSKIL